LRCLFACSRDYDQNGYIVEFGPGDPWGAEAETFPLAICRAALKAVRAGGAA
jgi:hypothetical protein